LIGAPLRYAIRMFAWIYAQRGQVAFGVRRALSELGRRVASLPST
jgi:hypothetical protein